MLDIGGGRGEVTYHALERGAEVVYVDFADYAVELARKNVPEAEIHHKHILDFIEEEDRTFDIIFALDVIEHLTAGENEKLLAWIREHLDGPLVIDTPTHVNYLKMDEHIFVFSNSAKFREYMKEHGFKEARMLKAKDKTCGLWLVS